MSTEIVGRKKNGRDNRIVLPKYAIRRLKIQPHSRFRIYVTDEFQGSEKAVVLVPEPELEPSDESLDGSQ